MTDSPNPSPAFVTPRRTERAVTDDDWMKAMLHSAPFGSLGMVHAGLPYVKPTLFVYDETRQAVYFHGAPEGRTHSALAANPQVCFTVSQLGRLLPANAAAKMSIEYSSVMVFGSVSVIEGEEASTALQLLTEKYFPQLKAGQDYRLTSPEEAAVTTVYRLSIDSWSGKAHHAAPDFPGAFYYERPGLHDWRDFA